MIIALITLLFIFTTAFLVKKAKIHPSLKSYFLVLIAGIVTFLFEPLIIAMYTDGSVDGGIIQIFSTIFGVWAIFWSVSRMIKLKKEKGNKK